MKKRICTISGILLSLLLIAGGASAKPSAGTEAAESNVSSAAVLSQENESKKLLIGLSENLKEVPYDGEAAPDALLAALAKETGWDLTLENPVSSGDDGKSLTVAFAEKSAIYTAPPRNQKDDYRVSDAEDLIYNVLNSTAQTLLHNFQIDSVFFTAPDGGNLDFENGGSSFYLTTVYPWNESDVRGTNAALPEDSIGQAIFDPNGETCAGFENLNMLFKREDVRAGTGALTVYDGKGEVFFQCDISDAEKIEFVKPDAETLAFANWKSGTEVRVWLGKQLQANEDYTVQIDAGAIVSGKLKTREIGEGLWAFSCLDYGLGETNSPGKTDVKLGESVTQDILLGESAERAVITVSNADAATISPGELTEDGTVTFTPAAPGFYGFEVQFILKDGARHTIGISFNIVE